MIFNYNEETKQLDLCGISEISTLTVSVNEDYGTTESVFFYLFKDQSQDGEILIGKILKCVDGTHWVFGNIVEAVFDGSYHIYKITNEEINCLISNEDRALHEQRCEAIELLINSSEATQLDEKRQEMMEQRSLEDAELRSRESQQELPNESEDSMTEDYPPE